MEFSGLRPPAHASNLIDVTLAGVGDVDLRNDAHIEEIRFVPGPEQERDGFSLPCTVFEFGFYAVELRATVVG
ncbi:hypothetical protein V1227_13710 [Lentzea sp. DG1S-22]|uniref:hypothetical protein n=1 Tax=Lentzea sp. DG1S-22 TaxID=3108822 RepID=UPI002E78D086|nr:hypothetical protein [Lentzea sp. DG1S-22]WVH83758.1 hypothetical protein V1227_13710 [Lentzea sp. DG1S-22]